MVHELGRTLSPAHGIGSTLTATHFTGGRMVVLHVGDSSLFRWRDGKLAALTLDHNVGNEIRQRLARGETVDNFPRNRSALTRCIGQPPPLLGDITAQLVQVGDRYLLCSDGVTRALPLPEIGQLLGEQAEPADLCQHLVARANQGGGMDNATAVVIDLGLL